MMRISYADVLEEGVMNSVGSQVSDGADPAEKKSAKRRKIDLSDNPLPKTTLLSSVSAAWKC